MSPRMSEVAMNAWGVETQPDFILPLMHGEEVFRPDFMTQPIMIQYVLPFDWDPKRHLRGRGAWMLDQIPHVEEQDVVLDSGLHGWVATKARPVVVGGSGMVERPVRFNGEVVPLFRRPT